MVPEFQSMHELLCYRQSAMVLDLVEQSYRANMMPLVPILKEARPGIYSKTGHRCYASFDVPTFGLKELHSVLFRRDIELPKQPFARTSAILALGVKPVTSLEQALKCPGGIADLSGEVIMSEKTLRVMQRYLTDTPGTHPAQFKLTQMMLQYFVNSMCPHARMGALISQDSVFKPESIDLSDISGYFESLHTTVVDFVNGDSTSIYMLDIRENRAILEKSMDYRIYDYHEKKFTEEYAKADTYSY